MNQPRSLNIRQLKIHPAAEKFPLMDGKEYEDLKEDIRLRGLINPIVKKGNIVLDGRNRLRACEEVGVKPEFEEYDGEDPVGFIIAQNILRRNLTDEQRVAILAKLRGPQLANDAQQRMKQGKNVASKSTQGSQGRGRSYEHLAAEGNTTEHKARAALQVAKYTPEQLDDVIAGKQRLAQAAKAAKARRRESQRGVKKELTLRQWVEKKFVRFMESFSVQEYSEVRTIIREIVAVKS